MSILVCGGAGYIGSHMVYTLIENGEDVVVIDNLETGHLESVHPKAKFYNSDIRNSNDLDKIFSNNNIEAVIHFAANSLVGESMQFPLKYFNNNTCGMETLLEAMIKYGVKKIVFSSTAATYGEPKRIPILETDETVPTNPYGESKLMMEKMMKWVDLAHDIKFVSLRYFNVAGAIEDGSIGEAHTCETHLIPIILQVPLGKRDHINVYGTDYPTLDGTCIRDYVHVMDLADAHMKALNYLRAENISDTFNLGVGNGFSVMEMINAAEKVVGKKLKVEYVERRAGDPALLVACSKKAEDILDWRPKYTKMEDIIRTAWNWHKTHPNGYDK